MMSSLEAWQVASSQMDAVLFEAHTPIAPATRFLAPSNSSFGCLNTLQSSFHVQNRVTGCTKSSCWGARRQSGFLILAKCLVNEIFTVFCIRNYPATRFLAPSNSKDTADLACSTVQMHDPPVGNLGGAWHRPFGQAASDGNRPSRLKELGWPNPLPIWQATRHGLPLLKVLKPSGNPIHATESGFTASQVRRMRWRLARDA